MLDKGFVSKLSVDNFHSLELPYEAVPIAEGEFSRPHREFDARDRSGNGIGYFGTFRNSNGTLFVQRNPTPEDLEAYLNVGCTLIARDYYYEQDDINQSLSWYVGAVENAFNRLKGE